MTLARILHAINPFARAYNRGVKDGVRGGYDGGYEDGIADTKRQFAIRLDDQERSIRALQDLQRAIEQ